MAETAFYFANVVAGIPFGILLKSNFERTLFPGRAPWLPFSSISWLGLLSGVVVKILLVAILFLSPFILLSKVAAHFHVCSGSSAYLLYLIGIVAGKALRYMYWYRKREWL